ncbi:MAG TPA: hypothetical protein VHJ20_11930 [Polyangia bacterium]|nr:hypothetical protein [Polyangia bacterium]
MFRDNIQKVIDKLEGGIAGVLMGFDGITLESYAKPGFGDSLPDIQTLAAEFAHLVAQAKRAVQSLDAGSLAEVTVRTDTVTVVFGVVSDDYFLACAMLPTAIAGKARYLVRMAAPKLRADL